MVLGCWVLTRETGKRRKETLRNSKQIEQARFLRDRSIANANPEADEDRTTAGNQGWAYYPGNELLNNRIADAVVFVNNNNELNIDGETKTPNRW